MRRAALLLLLLVAALGCRFGGPQASSDIPVIPTARVEGGDFRVTVEEVGVLQARTATQLKAPFHAKVSKVVDEGTQVTAGDPVLWLDTTELDQQLAQLDANLAEARSQMEKQLERIAFQRKSTTLDLAVSEANLRFEEQKLESARREEADAKRQADLGLISSAAHERKVDELRAAELSESNARFAHERKLEEVRGEERRLAVDRQEAERTFAQTRERRDKVAREIGQAVLSAPAAGEVFLPKQRFRGQGEERKVRSGDFVHPWIGSLIELPDRSTMEVRSQVDETLLHRVVVGTPVEVRLTAVEGVVLPGRVAKVDLLAVPRSQSEGAGFAEVPEGTREQVVFPVTVSLDRLDDRLQPGMTVGVSFLLETVPGAVWIPEDAVFGSGEERRAFVRTGQSFDEREIELGVASGGKVVVTSGVEAGEEVYLGDPRGVG